MPEQEKARRWTIFVCPNCGERKGGAYFCRCVIPSARCETVEIAEVSALRAEVLGHIRERRRLAEIHPSNPKTIEAMEAAAGVVEEFFDLKTTKGDHNA
jgi:hypothetical protein